MDISPLRCWTGIGGVGHKDNGYGHGVHVDLGLISVIPVTPCNPSLQMFDQREDEWVDIECLIQDYCNTSADPLGPSARCHAAAAPLVGDL